MILTCPECASRYFVDDARIGPDGRKVRCASCGHAWREAAPVPQPMEEAAFTLMPAGESPSFAPADVEPVKLRGVRADAAARLRTQAAEKRKTREAAAVGVIWAVMGAGFCILAVGAVIFRTDVVRLMPVTAGAYAFARMPVNPTGLAIEGVAGGPGLQDGRAALKVSGVERNVETHPRDAAPVRISLLDKGGHKIATQVATPQAGPIQPGETRPFTISFFDPPMQAASFQVEFAFDAMKPAARPAPKKAAPPAHAPVQAPVQAQAAPPMPSDALKLRGAAPAPVPAPAPPTQAKEAQPLPASSPYALPSAASAHHG